MISYQYNFDQIVIQCSVKCGVVFIFYVENTEECVGWQECERYVKAPLHHYPPRIYITPGPRPQLHTPLQAPGTGLTDHLVKSGRQYHWLLYTAIKIIVFHVALSNALISGHSLSL